MLENEWKRPTVNMAIWKEGERRRKKGDDGGGKEQCAWRAGRVRGEERRRTTTLLQHCGGWGLTVSQSSSGAQTRTTSPPPRSPLFKHTAVRTPALCTRPVCLASLFCYSFYFFYLSCTCFTLLPKCSNTKMRKKER